MSTKDPFKDTLHLPRTDFPMKANLPEREKDFINTWHKNQIYKKMVQKKDPPSGNKNSNDFFFLDGPIYSNGNLHLGHVLGKILKDIVIKYKNLSGRQAPFIPTWDCHGLPIEMAALKKIKSEDTILSDKELRALCRKEARFWIEKQQESFQRLGVLAHWDKRVSTMDSDYEAEEVRALAKIAERGLLFRGRKPVLWCFKLKTALAFSEAEYRTHKSPSIYVGFPLTKESCDKLGIPSSASLVIWTTTPWTLPANEAVCLHPDFDYGLYKGGKNSFYVVAQGLKESFEKETGITLPRCEKTFKGKEWEGITAHHPFIQKDVPIILGNHVTLDSGTGCVHTAPGHGLDDFLVGKKYSLKESCPVDGRGHFTESAPEELKGLFIFKGNKVILEKLKEKGHLLAEKEVTHSYPYNPRSNSPLIYRLTPQWFLNLDDSKYPIRSQALKACEKNIQFVPSWGKARLEGMLKSSPDWCLSRQRFWGVPLAVFYCENCSVPYLNPQVMEQIADKMEESKKGVEYYFSVKTEELLPKGLKCESCEHTRFRKGTDIVDVWFDSGVEHRIFRKKGYPFPADLFLEGSDQHRGWFHASLISSLALDGAVPFKTLVTHGFVNDLGGRKMSKSRGNIMDPVPVIQRSGAEILRLWTASEDYSQDISVGEEMFQRVTDTYRRFRNTMRFLLGNLKDFTEKDCVAFSDLSPVDKWSLIQLNQLVKDCMESFDSYTFHKIYHSWNRFFTVTLSSFYLDIIKDRLYTFGKNSPGRRQAQTVLYHLLDRLLPLMAPITVFLSEETYSYFSKKHKKESVLLETLLPPHPEWKDQKVEQLFEKLFSLRDQLNKQLEDLRAKGTLGSALQAEARLTVPKGFFSCEVTSRELCEFFSVSKITVEEAGSDSSIKAVPARGEKCLRCWFYSPALTPEKICHKCVENLSDKFQ